MIEIQDSLSFDDVLLKPQYSTVRSRNEVDTSRLLLKSDCDFELLLKHPIIPANMKTISGLEMCRQVAYSGGLAILHRFMPVKEQLEIITDLYGSRYKSGRIGVSVGVNDGAREAVAAFHEVGVRAFCIDIAHGDSISCVEMTQWIAKEYPDSFIIAGNVATGTGAVRLWNAGADAVKSSIGGGSLCSTRIETGNGVPTLSALMDIHEARGKSLNSHKYIIADGGIRGAGDCVKSLCFADLVMAGNIFAGCEETPGEVYNIDGIICKEYAGSSTHKANHIEGVSALVLTKGKYAGVLSKLLEGIRSGCSYQGVDSIKELQRNPQFIKITNAGLKESHPHVQVAS